MLTADGIVDVAGEIADLTAAGLDSLAWMESEEIDRAAMTAVFDSVERQFHEKVLADGDVLGAVIDLTGQAFRLGWESSKKQRA